MPEIRRETYSQHLLQGHFARTGPLQGRVLGGHAPIVDAHVFVLEGLWTGYAIKAKSLLGAGANGASGTYPVTKDTTTGSVTNGLYYVTSDLNGNFNVTGDYTCDVGFPRIPLCGAAAPSVTPLSALKPGVRP